MKKINFTEQELHELEALQIRGGDTASPQYQEIYNKCVHARCIHSVCHSEIRCSHVDESCENSFCGMHLGCDIQVPHLYNCIGLYKGRFYKLACDDFEVKFEGFSTLKREFSELNDR